MALDWPAFGTALWAISDQLGIRPEWQLPVLSMESGFDPSIVNADGCVGLNQFCPGTYEHYVSVPVSAYRTWPASAQLGGPISAYWRDALQYGQIRSATRLMLAQLGQSLLPRATTLDTVVFASPSSAYAGNSGLDTDRKGTITVQDLAHAMRAQASSPAVQDAIARAYAMRPGEQPRDPVYGDDYYAVTPVTPPANSPASGSPLLVAAGAIVLTAVAGFAASQVVNLRAQKVSD